MIREADRSRAVFSSIDGAAPPGFLDHGAEYLAGGRKDEASAAHRPGDPLPRHNPCWPSAGGVRSWNRG